MAFTREELKTSGVAVKLNSHRKEVLAPIHNCMHCTPSALERVVLAQDIALYLVAFRTTKRGDELNRTLVQRVICLPNESVQLNF